MKLSLLSTEWGVSSVHTVINLLTCCSSSSHRSSGNGECSSIAAQSQHRALEMCRYHSPTSCSPDSLGNFSFVKVCPALINLSIIKSSE